MKSSYERFYAKPLNINGPEFCIIGMMRSGSNYFERLLDNSSELACHGEIFNLAETSKYSTLLKEILGENIFDPSQEALDEYFKELASSKRIRWGFRIFNDHNERVMQILVASSNVKKILLKRNLLEAYVSLKRAQISQQWLLTNESYRAKDVSAFAIDIDEFIVFCLRQSLFYNGVIFELNRNKQPFLIVDYQELVTGRANHAIEFFLDLNEPLQNKRVDTIKQNTRKIEDQISNYNEVVNKLQGMRIARWVI